MKKLLRSKIKTLVTLCALLAACIGAARFTHHQTKGFRLAKIQHNLSPFHPQAEPLSPQQKHFLTKLFQQKFHYLGRGIQCFAFVSEDDQYVLKLFNNRYQQKIQLFDLLTHLPGFKNYAEERKLYFTLKLQRTLSSYRIAAEEMPEQTAIEFLHIAPSCDLPNDMTLLDPLQIAHYLDPNTTGFLIQRKATLVYPALQEWIENHERSQAEQAITRLLELFLWKFQHGIGDNDPLIRTNFGFIGDKPIQIDVGPLYKDPAVQDPEFCKQELLRVTTSLKSWLSTHEPELIPCVDDFVETHLNFSAGSASQIPQEDG